MSTDTDLFGDPIREPPPTRRGFGSTRKCGYAALPGTGPEGQTCRQCAHYCITGSNRKTFPKCGLMRAKWTHGAGTDIKAGSPACREFTPKGAT
jgi:hypothetical protein